MNTSAPVDVGHAIDQQHRGSVYSGLILALCATTMIVEGYDVQLMAYATPAIIRDWHIERALFGPVFSAALLGYLLGATVLSGISDKLGRKRVIVIGNLFFGALTVASAFAETIPVLLALRFAAGLGLGCSIPAAMALGVEYAPEGRRAVRVSLLFIGYGLGASAGGFITAKLITAFGWQSAFFLSGGLSIAAGMIAWFFMPESARFLAVVGGRDREIGRIMCRLRPDLGITASTQFVAAEQTAEPGLPVRHLFTERRAWITVLLWIAFVTSLTGHSFLTSWLPTVLSDNGISLEHAVIAGSLVQAGSAVGGLLVGSLVDRFGIAAIAGTYVVSVPFVVLIGAFEMPEPLLMLILFMVGLVLLGGQIGLNALAGTIYPTFVRSSGAGWALGVGRVGSIIGPLVGGFLINSGMSLRVLFVCAAVPAAFTAVAVMLLHVITNARFKGGRPARCSRPHNDTPPVTKLLVSHE